MDSVAKRLTSRVETIAANPIALGAMLDDAIALAASDEVETLTQLACAHGADRAAACGLVRLADSGTLPAWAFTVDLRATLVDRCLISAAEPGRVALLEMLARRADPRLLSPVVDRLVVTRRRSETGPLAADVLLATIVRIIGRSGRRAADSRVLDRLEEAVTDAVAAYRRHRQDAVAIAAALLAGRSRGRLRQLLRDPDRGAWLAVRGAFDRSDDPLLDANLVRWLSVPGLERAVERRLEQRATAGGTEILDQTHLTLTRARRRALLAIDRVGRLLPTDDGLANLSIAQQCALPRLAHRLRLSAAARVRTLTVLRAAPAAPARALAATTAALERTRPARELLHAFARDRAPVVAYAAGRELLPDADPRELQRLERAAHPGVASRATRRLAGLTPRAFVERSALLTPTARRVAARTLARRDAATFVTLLSGLMERGPAELRLGAIGLVRDLDLVAGCEETLRRIVAHGPPRLASAAVAALARGAELVSVDTIRLALIHDDARVRANAVEAMAQRAPSDSTLVECLPVTVQARHNRLRGNGVRLTLDRSPEMGLESLHSMLGDREPMHRVSALWVARTARAVAVGPAIARIAETDPVPLLRRRAELAGRMIDPLVVGSDVRRSA